ncbi:hypothetical protein [Maribacter sp. Asnod1-A12]|uniref:hypothetical protein n=1 Tax=Maribacter sp. Asnod1-A12 TaxID=3160576 RepID=UPI00386A6D7B
MNKTIIEFFKEILTIIVGILIALFINNWNEDRKDAKYMNQIFISMDMELKETNEDIKKKILQQQTLIDTLELYKKNNTISIFNVMMKVNGVQIPQIRISSWKAISSSKIELLEYDRVSTLVNIEEKRSY